MKSLRAFHQDILTEVRVAYKDNENTVTLSIMIRGILFQSTEKEHLAKL